MRWPIRVPVDMRVDDIVIRAYDSAYAEELFAALDDARAWEHIPHTVPARPAELDQRIRSRLAEGTRLTFIIRRDDRVVGMTSVLFDPDDPEGVEVGGTQLAPTVWGTGVNRAVKDLLLDVLFREGARWVQLRTDERNERSTAAIRKLGARDPGVHQDHRVRHDGTRRRSRMFRIDRPDTADA